MMTKPDQTFDTKPFKTTKQIFYVVLLLVILSVALYAYLAFTVVNDSKKVNTLANQIRTLQSEEKEIGGLKKQLTSMEQHQADVASYFIDANDIVPFLETVEGYGKATSVEAKFDSFSLQKKPVHLAVALTATGTFLDLYHFLRLLENAPYSITISDMHLDTSVPLGFSPEGAGDHSAGWQLRMNLSVSSITGI